MKRFCIKIDGNNDHFDPGNIQKVVRDFFKEAMQTEDVKDVSYGGMGFCAHEDATKYTIPTYLSLARYISTSTVQGPTAGLVQDLDLRQEQRHGW
ncbi:hypothetical protein MN608_10849 [Microdochium nivale]|nr:hypothetical protein MN608_10849 [Microdochium nivale]